MGTHEELARLVERYETLTPEARAQFDEHARECDICAARLAIRQYGARQDVEAKAALVPAKRRRALGVGPLVAVIAGLLAVLALAGGPAAGVRLPFVPAPAPTPLPAALPSAGPPNSPTRAPSVTPAPEVYPPAALAWLRAHAEPLRNLEPGASQTDLGPLARALASKRVVVVDDNSFGGSDEGLALQQRLLELLAGRAGSAPVTVLAEVPWPDGEAVERYIQEDIGQPEGLLLSRAGPGLQTQQTLYTLRWMRAHADRVHFIGFLPPAGYSPLAQKIVTDYFLVVDPASLGEAAGDQRRLVQRLAARRDVYVSSTTLPQYNTARMAAQVMLESDQLARARDPADYAALYDQFTLANVQRLLPTLSPGPILVWLQDPVLANDHIPVDVTTELQDYYGYLQDYYGPQILLISTAYYEGSLYSPSRSPAGGQAEAGRTPVVYQAPAALPGSWEAYFHEAGLPAFVLQVERGRVASLPAWLAERHPGRTLPPAADACIPAAAFRPVALGTATDVIVFFDRVQPAALLSAAPPVQPAACPTRPPDGGK